MSTERRTTIATIDAKYIIDRQGKPAVLYAGLLDAAHRTGLRSIRVQLVQAPTEQNGMTAISHATVEMEDGRVHEEIGDATPQNVGRMVALHIIRMSATRAKARALRDALNVGGTALEEYGPEDADEPERAPAPERPRQQQQNGAQQQRPSTAPPVADVPGACQPATKEQRTRLAKLQAALGQPLNVPEGLSWEEATHQITELVKRFNDQAKGGRK